MSASQDWLAHFANECRRNIAAIRRLDRRKVDIDITARKAEVKWARGYLAHRPRLIKELEKRGQSEEEWCATLGKGHSISQVRRAIQLARPGALQRYIKRRRALGDNGRFGLPYAIELAQQEGDESATSPHPQMRGECDSETPAETEKPSPREAGLEARVAELESALATRVGEPESATRQKVQPPVPLKRYWRIPPETYARLHAQYGFNFDPFPYPRGNFDGLAVKWGRMNFVNAPFSREDEFGGRRMFDVICKAIAEQMLGNSSLILVPVNSVTNQLLAAGAIGTSLGRPKWLEVSTGEPAPAPGCCAAFLLKGITR